MASLAESINMQANQAVQKSGDTVKDALEAHHIASTTENARKQLDMQKQNNDINKANSIMSMFATLDKLPDAAQDIAIKSFKKSLPTFIDGFNMDNLDLLQKDREFRKTYIANMIARKRQGGYSDPQEALKDIGGYGGDVTAFLAGVKQDEDRNKALQIAAMKAEAQKTGKDGAQERFETNLYGKFKTQFDSETKKARSLIDTGDNIINLLASGGPIAAKAVTSQLPRMAGEVGVLTDNDVARWGGAQDLMSRMDTFMTKIGTGDLTEATRKEYKAIVGEFQAVAKNKLKYDMERTLDSAEGQKLDRARMEQVLAVKGLGKTALDREAAVSGIRKALAAGKSPESVQAWLKTQDLTDGQIAQYMGAAKKGK